MSDKVLEAKFGSPDKPLKIGKIEIPCYVLEDGQRVIVQRGLFKALGIIQGGSGKYKEYGGAARLVGFLEQNNVTQLISSGLEVLQNPIIFKFKNTDYYGYEATILQEITRAISKSYLKGELPEKYNEIGRNAELLDDAFAKVGIIALVDEATGYQHQRERTELQRILKAFISPELLPWEPHFPDSFYQELFRLNAWDYTVKGIKKRPGVIGKWTNKLVYEELPKGVLEALKKNTPKSIAGNYTKRFFQRLTEDVGEPQLNAQIIQIMTLFRLSDNMQDMWNKFEKLRNKPAKQMDLPFQFDENGHTIDPVSEEEKTEKLSGFNQKLKMALNFNPKG